MSETEGVLLVSREGMPSMRESDRAGVIGQLAEKRLRQREAAEEPIPVEDGKTVRGRVDAAKAEQRARPAYKPPPDHPSRRPFKPAAASVAAGG